MVKTAGWTTAAVAGAAAGAADVDDDGAEGRLWGLVVLVPMLVLLTGCMVRS